MHTILTHAGFRDNRPVIDMADGEKLIERWVVSEPLTLAFDTSQRYCTGWHDLDTGESHACPDLAAIEQKFTQCPGCQRRTGFNPAFYHATSVSSQQDKRNHEPHFLYLAYFAPNVVKIGISYSGRENARLLEQGARAAYILDTLPTALIARQYEEKISSLDKMHEHLTARRKRELWANPYDSEQAKDYLDAAIAHIKSETDTAFSSPRFIDLDPYYFIENVSSLDEVAELRDGTTISGQVVGCLGTDIITRNNDRLFSLHLKNFVGYPVTIKRTIEPLDATPIQASLF